MSSYSLKSKNKLKEVITQLTTFTNFDDHYNEYKLEN